MSSCSSSTTSVTRVIDGDTVVVVGDIHVRILGINTPERGQCYYKEATEYARKVLNGQSVRIVQDVSQPQKDKYGRTLAYVYINGNNFSLLSAEGGYAKEYISKPPISEQDAIHSAVTAAEKAKKGVWNCGR